tara:strand:- start:76 stop:189 length:114 start_codon:yes stop_codon:yes gene_type:complete
MLGVAYGFALFDVGLIFIIKLILAPPIAVDEFTPVVA